MTKETEAPPINVADAKLNEVAISQLVWKSETMRAIGCRVVTALFNAKTRSIYPDEIDVADVRPEDVNCIGSTYRQLVKFGVIELTRDFRRSTTEKSKGRLIHAYRLASKSRAKTFLQRNGGTVPQSADAQMTLL